MAEAEFVIVTRHAGLVAWLAARGIEGHVIAHATIADVEGYHVIGNVPLYLAAYAAAVTTVDLPGLKPEQRGQDLTPAEMDAAGAELNTYTVRGYAPPAVGPLRPFRPGEKFAV